MKKTFVDVLLELPVDATLQSFLAANGLPLPDDLSWSDGQEVTQTVIETTASNHPLLTCLRCGWVSMCLRR